MSIKTFVTVIIVILSAPCMHSFAVEVLTPLSDVDRPRRDSWSERQEVISAIAAYKEEIDKLSDLFVTGETAWRSIPDIAAGQPFIGDKREGEEGFVDNASNRRFMHIQDIALCLKKLRSNIDSLTKTIDEQNYDDKLNYQEAIKIQTMNGILYHKVNGENGMRDYGMSFSRVTKPEWNGQNALTRFNSIIGEPFTKRKGSLQMALDRLLLTINSHTIDENHI